jgi:hypothetical protein
LQLGLQTVGASQAHQAAIRRQPRPKDRGLQPVAVESGLELFGDFLGPPLPLGIGLFVGAIVAAIGMSIVAVLVLRAQGEWRMVQADQAERARRR